MPLSKAKMRERKRLDRLNVKPKSNLNADVSVKPNEPVIPKTQLEGRLRALGLKMEGKKIVGIDKQPNLPLYDPKVIVPDLDADGYPM